MEEIESADVWKCFSCCEKLDNVCPRMQIFMEGLNVAKSISMYTRIPSIASTTEDEEEENMSITDDADMTRDINSILQVNFDFLSSIIQSMNESANLLEPAELAKKRSEIHSELLLNMTSSSSSQIETKSMRRRGNEYIYSLLESSLPYITAPRNGSPSNH